MQLHLLMSFLLQKGLSLHCPFLHRLTGGAAVILPAPHPPPRPPTLPSDSKLDPHSRLRFSRSGLNHVCCLLKMATRRNVQYSRLLADEDDDGGNGGGGGRYDPRFDYTPGAFDRIPWKSIALAIFLLFLGSLLLFLSYFIFTGHMGGDKSQAYGLLALGIITFLPGFYETRMAYYSWRGVQGYRFASIPDY